MTPLVDSHCHLADPRFDGEVEQVLARAREAGIVQIVSVSALGPIDFDIRTIAIAKRNPQVFAAIAVHPHDARDCTDLRIEELRRLAQSPRVVAIGESGLDFHYMRSPAAAQEDALRRHLELARDLGKPIVIHCRDAADRVIAIVRETGLGAAGGVIHCFSEDAAAARRFVELGFYLSFSGILTFRNAPTIREAARVVPEDRLMVETDAPYLAPEPYRGKRNEPAYVRRTLEVLAHVRGSDADVLAQTTSANTRRLFRIPPAPA